MRLSPMIRLIRPRQWLKNGFILMPILFALRYHDAPSRHAVALAVVVFIAFSSVTYILNDLRDAAGDRLHSVKKLRPIAAGEIGLRMAIAMMALLALIGLFGLSLLPPGCGLIAGLYLAMTTAYSFGLKRIALLDVTIIALGFVLRVLMGGYAAQVEVSPWIVQVTFLLALFLGFGKRYHELLGQEVERRVSLKRYNEVLLDKLMVICCGCTLLSYSIYAVETATRLHLNGLVYSTGFVAFGLFRYLQHLYLLKGGGSPEQILLSDPVFLLTILLWLGFCLWQLQSLA